MQHSRSPPAPEPATEVSAVGFAEIQEVTENFSMQFRCKHGFEVTKPHLNKAKTTSCTYSEQQIPQQL